MKIWFQHLHAYTSGGVVLYLKVLANSYIDEGYINAVKMCGEHGSIKCYHSIQ